MPRITLYWLQQCDKSLELLCLWGRRNIASSQEAKINAFSQRAQLQRLFLEEGALIHRWSCLCGFNRCDFNTIQSISSAYAAYRLCPLVLAAQSLLIMYRPAKGIFTRMKNGFITKSMQQPRNHFSFTKCLTVSLLAKSRCGALHRKSCAPVASKTSGKIATWDANFWSDYLFEHCMISTVFRVFPFKPSFERVESAKGEQTQKFRQTCLSSEEVHLQFEQNSAGWRETFTLLVL